MNLTDEQSRISQLQPITAIPNIKFPINDYDPFIEEIGYWLSILAIGIRNGLDVKC